MRTGLGGQKVVLDSGAFMLPIVHELIPVGMNTLRPEVSRRTGTPEGGRSTGEHP